MSLLLSHAGAGGRRDPCHRAAGGHSRGGGTSGICCVSGSPQPCPAPSTVKPSPPFNLTATFSDGYNISWETIYQHPDYFLLGDELEYELRYKKRSDPWEVGGG